MLMETTALEYTEFIIQVKAKKRVQTSGENVFFIIISMISLFRPKRPSMFSREKLVEDDLKELLEQHSPAILSNIDAIGIAHLCFNTSINFDLVCIYYVAFL